MRHLDSDALAALVAVADFGTFTAAAEYLGKTQAAVSICIARLEERLEKRLFERTPRRVIPTIAGESLIGYARKMQIIEAEALSALTHQGSESRVRLGMPDDFISSLGDALLHKFGPQNRHIFIDFTCDFSRKLRMMMDKGDLDVAIVVQMTDDPRGKILGFEKQIWCTGRESYPERESCLRLVLFSDECSARPHIFTALEQFDRPWRLVHSSSHIAGIHLAVESGNLLTVLPERAVPSGWRRLGPADGLPALPDLPLALLMSPSERLAARKIATFLEQEFACINMPASSEDALVSPSSPNQALASAQ
jgi:DNA-binding transcriptional LysR family regulator